MARILSPIAALLCVLLPCFGLVASAAEPLERVLPPTTKGFVSIPNIDRTLERWDETQLGQLLAEPMMQSFVQELRNQFQGDFLSLSERFGVRVGQLRELRGGEVCLAFVQPVDAVRGHAAVLLMDVAGRESEAKLLLDTIIEDLRAQGAVRSSIRSAAAASLTQLDLPLVEGKPQSQSFLAIHRGRLLITDCLDVANAILLLMDGGSNHLANDPAFKAIMAGDGGADLDVRWFVEPFGLAEVLRAADVAASQPNSIDVLEVLSNQGFGAIKGVGGQIRLATGKHEIFHRTVVYAPGNKQGKRFELAARMLNFPNSSQMTPHSWAPANLTTHMTLRWDIRNAFEYSKSLVNEYAGEQVFEEIIRSIATDESGPQIDIRKDLIRNFSDRITVIADHAKPLTADSERIAVAIELANESAVREAVAKAMANDPSVLGIDVAGVKIWQMGAVVEEEEEETSVVIESPGGVSVAEEVEEETSPYAENPFSSSFDENPFGPPIEPESREDSDDEDESDKLLSKLCVAVAHGHLFVSKKVDFLHYILTKKPNGDLLHEQEDFKAVQLALKELGSDVDAARFFVRTDKAYHPTYEMLRTGQMPESTSMFGQFLNQAFGQPGSDRPRMQQINGSTMPSFENVRGYLGPAGMFIRSTKEGWIITGCLLRNPLGA